MPEQEVTLYIHIGMGKTGTSSIQNFLAGNHKVLWNLCSCLYPNMVMSDFLNGSFINHQKLFLADDIKSRKEKILTAVDFCRKHSRNKIIFSAEALFEDNDGPALAKELSEIPGVNLKIIVYIRRQDQWLESAWKEWGYKSNKYRDISHYIQQRDCNWLKALRRWEGAVGRARIIVRCYEKAQMPDGLIPDFFQTVGIDYNANKWRPQKDLFKGFKGDVMEVIFLNKRFCTGDSDTRLQGFFERNLDESFQKESFKSYSFLSPTEKISVLTRYESANQTIAREFLGRDDGVLFYEPWPEPNEPWEPYGGLTVEKVIPIFTQALCNMDDFYNNKNRPFRGQYSNKTAGSPTQERGVGIFGVLDAILHKCKLKK